MEDLWGVITCGGGRNRGQDPENIEDQNDFFHDGDEEHEESVRQEIAMLQRQRKQMEMVQGQAGGTRLRHLQSDDDEEFEAYIRARQEELDNVAKQVQGRVTTHYRQLNSSERSAMEPYRVALGANPDDLQDPVLRDLYTPLKLKKNEMEPIILMAINDPRNPELIEALRQWTMDATELQEEQMQAEMLILERIEQWKKDQLQKEVAMLRLRREQLRNLKEMRARIEKTALEFEEREEADAQKRQREMEIEQEEWIKALEEEELTIMHEEQSKLKNWHDGTLEKVRTYLMEKRADDANALRNIEQKKMQGKSEQKERTYLATLEEDIPDEVLLRAGALSSKRGQEVLNRVVKEQERRRLAAKEENMHETENRKIAPFPPPQVVVEKELFDENDETNGMGFVLDEYGVVHQVAGHKGKLPEREKPKEKSKEKPVKDISSAPPPKAKPGFWARLFGCGKSAQDNQSLATSPATLPAASTAGGGNMVVEEVTTTVTVTSEEVVEAPVKVKKEKRMDTDEEGKSKARTYEYFIDKYGEKKGRKKWEAAPPRVKKPNGGGGGGPGGAKKKKKKKKK